MTSTGSSCRALTVSSAPCFLARASLSSSMSTAATRSPMATAYWTAMCPSPPIPEMVTHWPGRVSVIFRPLYTVTPAHSTGATSTGSDPAGMRAANRESTSMYSPKEPSTLYPPFCCASQSVSHPVRQYWQSPQADHSQALPTRSPTARSETPSPRATTSPTPSWPGTNGGDGLTGQSPSAAWRSVWQTPVVRTLTRACPGPGWGMAMSLTLRSVPNSVTTAACIVVVIGEILASL